MVATGRWTCGAPSGRADGSWGRYAIPAPPYRGSITSRSTGAPMPPASGSATSDETGRTSRGPSRMTVIGAGRAARTSIDLDPHPLDDVRSIGHLSGERPGQRAVERREDLGAQLTSALDAVPQGSDALGRELDQRARPDLTR